MPFLSLRHLAFAAIATAAIALSLPRAAAAQTGATIGGTVTTIESHAPISGARVAIEQPARLAITDEHGRFKLRELPAGTYTVVVTALGREPFRGTVTTSNGRTATLDAALKQGSLLLSSVVVSATRTATEANQVASTVNVLTPEHIQTSPSRETQDMLREIPAVELKRQSSLVDGSAQIVSIRGVDEGRTVVLFDGIPVSDAWGEWIDWGRVPKGMLDRVEVISGGTSSLYGNGAMGGLISFFSRPLAPGSGSVTLDAGNRSQKHAFFQAGLPVYGALSADVSGDYLAGGGYRLIDSVENRASLRPGTVDVVSEAIQRNAFLRLNYAPSTKWSGFATGHLFGDTRHTGTPLALTRREFQQVDLGATYGRETDGMLSLRAWNGRQEENQRATTIRANAASAGCVPSAPAPTPRQCEDSSLTAVIPSHDWGASAVWTRANLFSLQSLSVGADYRHMNGAFDERDFSTTCPGATCGAVTRTVWSGGDQNLSGAFVQAIAAPFEPLRIEVSARVDAWNNANASAVDKTPTTNANNTTYPDSTKTAFSPRVGLRYRLPMPQAMGTFSLHGAYYQAFRAPNLAELYRKQVSATSITLPNPFLKPEYALGREAGFDWQPVGWAQLKGTWYVADYKDFNVPTTFAAGTAPAACGAVATCRQRQNVSKSRSEGGELSVALRPIQQLYVSGGVNYDDARQQSQLPAGTTDDHKPHINRVPSPRQTIRATYTSPMLGAITALWKHEGKTTTLQGLWIDPFTVLDANVQRELVPGLLGFVSVENIGDAKFQVNTAAAAGGNSPQFFYGMPRTVRIGLTASR